MTSLELWENVSKYNIGTFSIYYEKKLVDMNGNLIGYKDTIFHEYFHLVQFLTTIFGLWLFINELEIFFMNSFAFKKVPSIDKFRWPYKCLKRIPLSKKIDEINHAVFNVKRVNFAPSVKFVKFVESKNKIHLLGKYTYPTLVALFKDEDHTFEYELTAKCICEAYSKAVEYDIYPPFKVITARECRTREFEYYAARLILQYYFPKITEEQIAIILHWSLNHVSPCVFFREIIIHLKDCFNQNLPFSSKDISEKIFDLYQDKYSGFEKELIQLLENIVIERVGLDNFLLPVLSSLLAMYKNNFKYLSSKSCVPVCLDLYPFGKKYNSNDSTTSLIESCSKILPLVLYQREEDGRYFFVDGKFSRSFFRLETLFFLNTHLTKRKLRKKCPFHKNCRFLVNGKCCKFKIYEANTPCDLGNAMEYFR